MNACPVQYDLREINTLIYNAKARILDVSGCKVRDILYQHGFTENTEDRNLEHYLYALQELRTQIIKGVDTCLCEAEVEELMDNTRSAVGILCDIDDRVDMTVDSSNYGRWVVQNPDLLTYPEWERCLYDTALQFEINTDAIKVEDLCKQVEVIVEIEKLDCGLDQPIDIKHVVCEYDHELKVDFQQCVYDHEILVTQHKCDLTLDEYVHMVKCGLDNEVITKAVDCGFDIEVDKADIKICSGGQVIAQVTPSP